MNHSDTCSRRRFLQRAAATTAVAAAAPRGVTRALLHADQQVTPGDRVNVGMIGVGRQAVIYNIKQFLNEPDAQVVAVCDVDAWRLDHGRMLVEEHYGKTAKSGTYRGCATYRDFRELLARDDIDAVMVSTPDHWHVPISLAAVQAGKHVCCEKPLTRTIAEGRMLSDAVRKHGRVFRTDSEFRSLEVFHRACELVRNGRIGRLRTIRAGVPATDVTCPPQPEMPVPEELDYKGWLGPAPVQPYTEKRVHPRHDFSRPGWMRVRDYCDGLIANWGAHLLDIAQWGNGSDRTGPVEVEGKGEYPPRENLWNVLLKFEVEYRYADGVRLFYTSVKPYVRFEGDEGWIYVEYPNTLKAEPESILSSSIGADEIHLPRKREKRDFLDAIRKKGDVMADQCRLDHVLAVEEVVAVGLVRGPEEPASELRQHGECDVRVFEVQRGVRPVFAMVCKIVQQRVRIDPPLSALVGLAGVEHRGRVGRANLIRRDRHRRFADRDGLVRLLSCRRMVQQGKHDRRRCLEPDTKHLGPVIHLIPPFSDGVSHALTRYAWSFAACSMESPISTSSQEVS